MTFDELGKVAVGETVWVIDGDRPRPIVVDSNGRGRNQICGVPVGWKKGQALGVTCFAAGDVFRSEEEAINGIRHRLFGEVQSAESRAFMAVRALGRFHEWLSTHKSGV